MEGLKRGPGAQGETRTCLEPIKGQTELGGWAAGDDKNEFKREGFKRADEAQRQDLGEERRGLFSASRCRKQKSVGSSRGVSPRSAEAALRPPPAQLRPRQPREPGGAGERDRGLPAPPTARPGSCRTYGWALIH